MARRVRIWALTLTNIITKIHPNSAKYKNDNTSYPDKAYPRIARLVQFSQINQCNSSNSQSYLNNAEAVFANFNTIHDKNK